MEEESIGKCALIVAHRPERCEWSEILMDSYLASEVDHLQVITLDELKKMFDNLSDTILSQLEGDVLIALDTRFTNIDVQVLIYKLIVDPTTLMVHPKEEVRKLGRLFHENRK